MQSLDFFYEKVREKKEEFEQEFHKERSVENLTELAEENFEGLKRENRK